MSANNNDESIRVKAYSVPILVNVSNSGDECQIYKGLEKEITPFSVVAVKFTLYGPALVVSMIIVAMIPVPARVMRRTMAVETLPMDV